VTRLQVFGQMLMGDALDSLILSKNMVKKEGNHYTFNNVPVRLGEDNSLHLDILKGTDIQLHSKKFAMYRKFNEIMKKQGYNPGLNIDSYSR